ncbi:MAG: hypothetical protein EXR77_20115 [Myxococcales bacterium]|nr:hypothetical protein [Myxococcales bacterium]
MSRAPWASSTVSAHPNTVHVERQRATTPWHSESGLAQTQAVNLGQATNLTAPIALRNNARRLEAILFTAISDDGIYLSANVLQFIWLGALPQLGRV